MPINLTLSSRECSSARLDRRMPRRTQRACAAVVAIFCVLASASTARADYKLQPGDVVEISVAGIPDLKQRLTVSVDGEVMVPMIPPTKIVGLDIAAAQAVVKQQLSQKLFQQRTSDGRENTVAISPDTVSLTIAEYRPIYLDGDITKPGEQPYRPGLTVRQAVSLAGGYEIMRFRMNNPFLESSDLRSEYQSQWMEYVKAQATVWRIKQELDPDARASLEEATQAPLPGTLLESLRTTARQQLDNSTSKVRDETAFLQKSVNVTNDQIDFLKTRQVKENESANNDKAEYDKLRDFAEHGNLPIMRLAEVRRLYLFSATQSLQTSVQLVSTVRDRDEYQRKISRLKEDHREELLNDLQDALVALDTARSKVQAVSEKITYTGMIRSQLSRGAGAKPIIMITHSTTAGGGSERAEEDSAVRPGDTIEVSLHTEVPPVPPTH